LPAEVLGCPWGQVLAKHSHWMSFVIWSFAKNLKCRVRTLNRAILGMGTLSSR